MTQTEVTTITRPVKDEPHIRRKLRSSVSAKSKQFSRKEVAEHNKEGDMWIIINDGVYDVTGWWKKHPGGKMPLLQVAGRDASLVFTGYHPDYVSGKYLKSFRIGTLSDPVSELALDFCRLNEQMKEEGMYDTIPHDYIFSSVVIAVAIGLSVYCARLNSVVGSLLAGMFMALFWQQSAFIGHDCGHNAVTHILNRDFWIGKIVTVAFGVSGLWWKKSHNTHHISPNSIDWDPDIQHLPFLAIDEKCLDGFYSVYHGHSFDFDGIATAFIPRQSMLFLPILGCSRVFMNVHSILRCFQNDLTLFEAGAELIALGLYWAWFVAYCVYMFESRALAALFVWSAHNFVGILHMQITLSHFSMDAYLGRVQELADEDVGCSWIRQQTETTMDVDTYVWMDWFHGGLQYQCIHHLFPRVARHKLRHVRDKYVVPFLQKHDITYHKNSWVNVLKEVYRHLRDQAAMVRSKKLPTSLFGEAVLGGAVILYTAPIVSNLWVAFS